MSIICRSALTSSTKASLAEDLISHAGDADGAQDLDATRKMPRAPWQHAEAMPQQDDDNARIVSG